MSVLLTSLIDPSLPATARFGGTHFQVDRSLPLSARALDQDLDDLDLLGDDDDDYGDDDDDYGDDDDDYGDDDDDDYGDDDYGDDDDDDLLGDDDYGDDDDDDLLGDDDYGDDDDDDLGDDDDLLGDDDDDDFGDEDDDYGRGKKRRHLLVKRRRLVLKLQNARRPRKRRRLRARIAKVNAKLGVPIQRGALPAPGPGRFKQRVVQKAMPVPGAPAVVAPVHAPRPIVYRPRRRIRKLRRRLRRARRARRAVAPVAAPVAAPLAAPTRVITGPAGQRIAVRYGEEPPPGFTLTPKLTSAAWAHPVQTTAAATGLFALGAWFGDDLMAMWRNWMR